MRHLADVRFVLVVASLMIVAVADSRKRATAELACVRPFACVRPLMHLKVTALVENLLAVLPVTGFIVTDLVQANELSSVKTARVSRIVHMMDWIDIGSVCLMVHRVLVHLLDVMPVAREAIKLVLLTEEIGDNVLSIVYSVNYLAGQVNRLLPAYR